MRELYKPKYLHPIDWSVFERDDAEARRRLLPASCLVEAVLAQLAGGEMAKGACLPWRKTWDLIRFREGEVTLWHGYNGHKKSMVLGQIAVGLHAQSCRVVMASFEMAPHRTLARMIKQALKGIDNEVLIRECCDLLRVWFYDQHGDAKPAQVYAMIRYAATLGMDQIIVDPLLKVVRGTDDYSGQKDFVAQLCALAREYGMHIHLVHHARKGQDEFDPPRKLDARGAGEITDQVDNVIAVWWNKRKDEKRENGQKIELDDPDAMLICDKQRNGAWEGKIRLWFHNPSLQFVEEAYGDPQPLLQWSGPRLDSAWTRMTKQMRQPGEDLEELPT